MSTLTATKAPARTAHLETELFSTKTARPGRGLDAPRFDGVDDLLDDSRSRLARVSARAAYQEVLFARAVLVDIRPQAQREGEGEVHPDLAPLVIERNVLEWRLDPRHPVMPAYRRPRAARHPHLPGGLHFVAGRGCTATTGHSSLHRHRWRLRGLARRWTAAQRGSTQVRA